MENLISNEIRIKMKVTIDIHYESLNTKESTVYLIEDDDIQNTILEILFSRKSGLPYNCHIDKVSKR